MRQWCVDKARVGPWDGKRKVVLIDRSLKPPSVKGQGRHIEVTFLMLLLISLGNSNNAPISTSPLSPSYVLGYSSWSQAGFDNEEGC